MNEVMVERENRYRTVNNTCGEIDYFDIRHNKIKDNKCCRFTCGRCRDKSISRTLNNVVKNAYKFGLFRHLVITCEGKEFRDKVTADESYDYLPKKWNSFKWLYYKEFYTEKVYYHFFEKGELIKKKINNILLKDFVKLKYISFFRSQLDGYAHLHILIGSFIPKEWVEKVLRSLSLGWGRIKFVDIHRIRNYLSKYWYKTHEWFIPENKKHFSTSREIKLNDYEVDKYNYFKLNPVYDWFNKFWLLDGYYEQIMLKTGYPPPYDFMLSEFYKNVLNV